MTTPGRAAILTALPVEYAAVREHLADICEEQHEAGTVYDHGSFTSDSAEWKVLIAEIGAGNVDAAVQAERVIEYFKPDVVLFVGVAGGIKDVALGDVVAATKIYGYESGKQGETFLPRPVVGLSSHRMEQRARAEARKRDWCKRIKGAPVDSPPRSFVGPIAAGEKVVANARSELAAFLRNNYGDALAVEMEGYGFLRAAHARNIEALVIRAISDLLENKATSDAAGWQERAASNASAFAFEVLAKLGAARESQPTSRASVPRRRDVKMTTPATPRRAGGGRMLAAIAAAAAVTGLIGVSYSLRNSPLWTTNLQDRRQDCALADVAPMQFLQLPEGQFQMGSPVWEPDRGSDETPHMAEVGQFEIAVHEVTQKQWVEVMGTKPFNCEYGCGDDFPAQNVSWQDAMKFMNALTDRENKQRPESERRTRCYNEAVWSWDRTCTGYRLLTEVEWEYAARAGTVTAYSFGNEPRQLCAYGNGADRAAKRKYPLWPMVDCDDGSADLLPTGRKKANPWGLYDMHGNAWEWIWDWYGPYPVQSTAGYAGPEKGEWRVLRSGSASNAVGKLRSANRHKLLPSGIHGDIGFRCARGGSLVL
jgi:formylglycine-generating enzyme required for sulfatase activity